MILLSIIICTYNREALLKNCLEALVRQLPAFIQTTEVIVVDNNCTDGTADMVKGMSAEHGWLKYIKEEKQGLSHARNCGAELAQGVYLCYLDDDGKPGKRYLKSVYRVLREYQPDIAGGPVYPYYTSSRPRWFKDEFEIRRYTKISDFSEKCSVSGGNYIIRAELLRKLGMFPPSYGMVGNKTRLGDEKAVLLKYRSSTPSEQQRVYYSQECFIFHHVPLYKMRYSYFIKRGFFSGRALVQLKNQSWRSAWVSLKGLGKNLFIHLPLALLGRGSWKQKLALLLQQISLDAGKISMVLQKNLLSRSQLES
jgi:glycosyltransferase involved in cell wall biosynthesis